MLLNSIKAEFIKTKESLECPRLTKIEDEAEEVTLEQVDLVTKEDVIWAKVYKEKKNIV